MARKLSITTGLKFAYLHGFASSPLSTKGVQLQRWFENELNASLELPDLNIPSFQKQCLSRMVDYVEDKIIRKHTSSTSTKPDRLFLWLAESKANWFLIGSSFGGLVSTIVAQRQPQMIHSLLLLAPAFNPVQRWTAKTDIEQWKSQGSINYFNPATEREEAVDYEFFQDLHAYPPYPLVATCPLTIIHGLQDDVIPIETSREYMQRLQSVNSHPTSMIEVNDDHHLRKKKTLNIIKKIILDHSKQIIH
jgi:pimeloyl-ACP methyl ester carboxylesterase